MASKKQKPVPWQQRKVPVWVFWILFIILFFTFPIGALVLLIVGGIGLFNRYYSKKK